MSYKEKMFNEILDIAEKLFNSHGYCSIGVDTICKSADVSKATMYKYFTSKEGLIEQVLLRRDARFRESLILATECNSTPWDKVKSILEWHFNWFKSPGFTGCMFVSANNEFNSTNPNIVSIIKGHKDWLESLILSCLDENNIQRNEYARMIMIFIEGMISYAAIIDVRDDFQPEVNMVRSWIESMEVCSAQ